MYFYTTIDWCFCFFFMFPGWRQRKKSRRPRDVTASGRRVHPPAWGDHDPITITTTITISRRTRPLGRRPCSCSAPTTLSADTPGSSSNGHILFKPPPHVINSIIILTTKARKKKGIGRAKDNPKYYVAAHTQTLSITPIPWHDKRHSWRKNWRWVCVVGRWVSRSS